MVITIHGEPMLLLYEENVSLIPQLEQRLANASEQPTPAGDRPSQAPNLTPLALAFRHSA